MVSAMQHYRRAASEARREIMVTALRREAADWRAAARVVSRKGLTRYLFHLTTTDEMKQRHKAHHGDSRIPFTPRSRSLVCLLLALECEDEIREITATRTPARTS